jgi:hypothetical protein
VKLRCTQAFRLGAFVVLPARMAQQAKPAPTASANPTATSPEITCQHSRPRWIFSFCTSRSRHAPSVLTPFQHVLIAAVPDIYSSDAVRIL